MARIVKPTPTPAPTPTPTPPEPARTTTLGSYGNASIDQWDEAFIDASAAVKRKKGVTVNPRIIKAMMDVETGGDGSYPAGRCRGSDGYDSVPACGPMQIKHAYHKQRCPECDFRTVEGQIELATHIIGDTMKERGRNEYDALVTTYFPGDDVNGTSQGSYVGRVKKLVAQMEQDAGGTTPAPVPVQDPISVIVGGDYPAIDYGFGSDAGLNYYSYGVGHGTSAATQHTGYDVGVPLGTPLYTPVSGVVDCVGGQGTPRWGQGCGAYADTITGGVGNITIMLDSGHKLTLGHCNQSLVSPGERVVAGQQVGTSGGMNGPHVHVETSVNRNGSYYLVDPGPALREAMGGKPVPTYAKRLPIPQPQDFDKEALARVIITEDGVPLLQRADANAAQVDSPFEAGEEFKAAYLVRGNDRKWYWVSSIGTRIPVEGTASPDAPVIPKS